MKIRINIVVYTVILVNILFYPMMCFAEDGVGLWVGSGVFSIDPPNSSDSSEVTAFIEAFNQSREASGEGFGIFADTSIDILGLEGIGIGFGRSQGTFSINKTADPEGTPEDSNDDIVIEDATRFASNFVVFLKTIEFFTFGLGTEDGHFIFNTISATGNREERTFSFSYPYFHLSFSAGGPEGVYLALVSNFLTSATSGFEGGAFSGTTNALLVGWIF